jgi:hypothetical protein
MKKTYDKQHKKVKNDLVAEIDKRIADRTLFCDFKNAFKIAEKYYK